MELENEVFLKLMNEQQIVEKLEKTTLEQLSKVFKVEDGSNDFTNYIKKLKQKIADILCSEADAYPDYLALNKFKVLNLEDTLKMKALFNEVWKQYQFYVKKMEWKSSKDQIEQLIPKFDTLAELQNFHFELLKLYKSSGLSQNSSKNQIQKKVHEQQIEPQIQKQNREGVEPQPFMMNHQINFQMGHGMGQNHMYPPPYYYPFPPPQNQYITKVEPDVENNQIIQSIQPKKDQLSFPIIPNYQSHTQFRYPPPEHFYLQDNTQQKRGPKRKEAQFDKIGGNGCKQKAINYFSKELQKFNQQFQHYQFIHCVCEGKFGCSEDYYTCQKCEFSYHPRCLKLEEKIESLISCPLCCLSKGTTFLKVFQQPAKMSWFSHSKGKKLMIQLNDRQIQKCLKAKKLGYKMQLKFLKIDGSSFSKNKPKNIFDHIDPITGKEKNLKHTDIALPETLLTQQEPVRIEIGLRDEESNKNGNPILYFFGVFLTMKQEIKVLVNQFVERANEGNGLQFYEEFRNVNNKNQIKIPMKDIWTSRQIMLPARGNNCDHIDVFDFQEFLGVAIDLKKEANEDLKCSICSQPCQSFRMDKIIYRAIQQDIKIYVDSQPEALIIQPDGHIIWKLQEDEEISEQQECNAKLEEE